MKRLLLKGFTPRRVSQFGDTVREIVRRLIERAGSEGEIDFVNEFSHHYTIRSIAQFIGMPEEDTKRVERFTVNFRLLGQVPMQPGIPKLEETLCEVGAYVTEMIEDRRRTPRADLISDMVAAQQDFETLTEDELLWATTNLLNAGHDTTRYLFASCIRTLIERDYWDRLYADPSLAGPIVSETVRLYPASPRHVRIPQRDVEVEGIQFRTGDVLVINLTAAGRDPVAFKDPDRFNPSRDEVFEIGFGIGAHFCVGNALAKMELVEGIKAVVTAWEKPEIIGPIEFKPTGVICGPEIIPIRFRRREVANGHA